MKPADVTATVVANKALPGRHCLLTVRQEFIARSFRPGQFAHVVSHSKAEERRFIARRGQPSPSAGSFSGLRILRRPFAIAGATDGCIRLLIKVVGAGSAWLARRKPGQEITMSGPTGNAFTVRDDLETALLVGGGTGIASLLSLCEELRRRGVRTMAALGTRSLAAFPLEVVMSNHRRAVQEFKSMGADSVLVTEAEDGLLVTHEAERLMESLPARASDIFTCGPWAMMAEMARICEARFPCQVSLEQRMVCGIGACRGCVVKVKEGGGWTYKTVCTEGPVFLADEVVWETSEVARGIAS